jgi:hypothetical protein
MLRSRESVVLDAIRTLFGISGLLKRTAALYGDDGRRWPRISDQTVSRIFVHWSTRVQWSTQVLQGKRVLSVSAQ